MKEEVHCACEFFSRMLRTKNLPHQFVDMFRARLEELLSQRFKDHWDTRNPNKGSGYRCIRINSKMDPVIGEAAKATGLKDITKYLPAEFTMWIDPRDVSYRFGEDGSICSCPLDFMVTRSEWSGDYTSTVSTVSSSSKTAVQPSRAPTAPPTNVQQPHNRTSSPPSRSNSSPSNAQSTYYHQVYRNLSSRLIQVQV